MRASDYRRSAVEVLDGRRSRASSSTACFASDVTAPGGHRDDSSTPTSHLGSMTARRRSARLADAGRSSLELADAARSDAIAWRRAPRYARHARTSRCIDLVDPTTRDVELRVMPRGKASPVRERADAHEVPNVLTAFAIANELRLPRVAGPSCSSAVARRAGSGRDLSRRGSDRRRPARRRRPRPSSAAGARGRACAAGSTASSD